MEVEIKKNNCTKITQKTLKVKVVSTKLSPPTFGTKLSVREK